MNKKILILRTENIGDFILSIPALLSIKNKYGAKNTTIVIKKENEELAKKLNFKNIIIYQDPLSKRNLKKIDIIVNLPKIVNFIKKIRKRKYDFSIEFSERKYNKLIMHLIKSDIKILGNTVNMEKIDELSRCNKLAERICKVKEINNLPLKLTKKEKNELKKILPKNNFITIHAITPINEKNWPLEKVKSLITKLKEQQFIFIGSKMDFQKIQEEVINNTTNTINFCGKINLTQTYYTIKKSKLYIGLDSGPLHLARFTKTPIIAIFGNTNEKRWAPKKNCKIIKNNNLKKLNTKKVTNTVRDLIE